MTNDATTLKVTVGAADTNGRRDVLVDGLTVAVVDHDRATGYTVELTYPYTVTRETYDELNGAAYGTLAGVRAAFRASYRVDRSSDEATTAPMMSTDLERPAVAVGDTVSVWDGDERTAATVAGVDGDDVVVTNGHGRSFESRNGDIAVFHAADVTVAWPAPAVNGDRVRFDDIDEGGGPIVTMEGEVIAGPNGYGNIAVVVDAEPVTAWSGQRYVVKGHRVTVTRRANRRAPWVDVVMAAIADTRARATGDSIAIDAARDRFDMVVAEAARRGARPAHIDRLAMIGADYANTASATCAQCHRATNDWSPVVTHVHGDVDPVAFPVCVSCLDVMVDRAEAD